MKINQGLAGNVSFDPLPVTQGAGLLPGHVEKLKELNEPEPFDLHEPAQIDPSARDGEYCVTVHHESESTNL